MNENSYVIQQRDSWFCSDLPLHSLALIELQLEAGEMVREADIHSELHHPLTAGHSAQ